MIKREVTLGIWAINVFHSSVIISEPPNEKNLLTPTLQASDVTDVNAEFIADPFITSDGSDFYMFFEVLDKSSNKGVIGLAKSKDGKEWLYDKVILEEEYHLSYPYVFKYNDEFYMIPESCGANAVFLYKTKNFPYEWEKECKLIDGKFVDSSIFQFKDRWWMFASKSGKLHLFLSDDLKKGWTEHPKSPLISNNYNITRAGGMVVVDKDNIYRYAQDGKPNYGNAIRMVKIKKLTETEYEEDQENLILKGTDRNFDWRKDGMHTIDQLKVKENQWLVVVDGHKLEKRNYFKWKLETFSSKIFYKKRIK